MTILRCGGARAAWVSMALVVRSATEKLLPVGYAEPFSHAASRIRTQGDKSRCFSFFPPSLFVLHVRDRNTHSPGQDRRQGRRNTKKNLPPTPPLTLPRKKDSFYRT